MQKNNQTNTISTTSKTKISNNKKSTLTIPPQSLTHSKSNLCSSMVSLQMISCHHLGLSIPNIQHVSSYGAIPNHSIGTIPPLIELLTPLFHQCCIKEQDLLPFRKFGLIDLFIILELYEAGSMILDADCFIPKGFQGSKSLCCNVVGGSLCQGLDLLFHLIFGHLQNLESRSCSSSVTHQ